MPNEEEKPRERFLKLRQIEVFLEAARSTHKSFAEAAAALGISTAALSQSIADLERNLGNGVRLFERNQAGATLTPAGRSLWTHGQQLLAAENATRHAVSALGTGPAKKQELLRIAYEPDFGSILTDATYALLGLNYFAAVQATESDTETVTAMVERGD